MSVTGHDTPEDPPHPQCRRQALRLFQPRRGGAGGRARRHLAPAVLAEGAAGKPGAAGKRPHRHGRRHQGGRRLARQQELGPRDRVPPGARPDAGSDRRAGGGRSRGDAAGDGRSRRRPEQDQPAVAGRSGDRPFGADRQFRHPGGLRRQRQDRVRAQRRALPLSALGPGRVRQFPPGAAGHRHLPSGQSRIPVAGRVDHRRGRPHDRLSRHAGRHRQPHDDGQRPSRARLGGRRHRGRGGDARPADLDADPGGRRLPPHRQTAAKARPRPTSC